jgi:hypothetical protein
MVSIPVLVEVAIKFLIVGESEGTKSNIATEIQL